MKGNAPCGGGDRDVLRIRMLDGDVPAGLSSTGRNQSRRVFLWDAGDSNRRPFFILHFIGLSLLLYLFFAIVSIGFRKFFINIA